MKVLAARELQDTADVRFLLEHLGLSKIDDVVEVVSTVFPEQPIGERARNLVEDVLAGMNADQSPRHPD